MDAHEPVAPKPRARAAIYGVLLAALLLLALVIHRGGLSPEGGGAAWFGASFPGLNNSFFHELAVELDASVQARGSRLMLRDCGSDPALQAAQIRQMIRQGAQAIFVCPAREDALSEVLRECAAADIPVIMVGDGRPPAWGCAVTSDNYSAGEQLAHCLAGDVSAARILIISREGSAACAAREQGFAGALTGLPGFTLLPTVYVQDHIRAGMTAVESALGGGLEFDTIFATGDGLAIGACAALRRRGLADRVRVLSVDGGPEGKRMVSGGYFAATAQQFPFLIAQRAAECAFQRRSDGALMVEPVKLITRNTIASHDLDKWE